MWGAAPRRTGTWFFPGLLVLAAIVVGGYADRAGAATPSEARAPVALPGEIWAVAINDRTIGLVRGPRMARLKRRGINAIVVRPGALTSGRLARLRVRARRNGLAVFVPARASSVRAGIAYCRTFALAHPGSRCALTASGVAAALALARSGSVDVVVVGVSALAKLRALAGADGRILAVSALRARTYRPAAWRAAITRTHRNASLDLAVAPAGDSFTTTFARYTYALASAKKSSDRAAPTPPPGLVLVSSAPARLSVAWDAAHDNKGVVVYGVYRNGTLVASIPGLDAAVNGLLCLRGYLLEVDAVDAAGNRSGKSPINTTTAPCRPNLVGAYSFDESGGAAYDTSGHGNLATPQGSIRIPDGRYGQSFAFDGIDDRLTVADSSSLDLTDGMTLEAWVKPSVGAGWRTAVLKERLNGLGYAIYSDTDLSRPAAVVYTGSESLIRGTAQVSPGAWTHLASTYDGTTLRLYVNGNETAAATVSGPLVATDGPLRIGGNAVWNEWFAGSIDEVRVYNRALSTAEIQADMSQPVEGVGLVDTEPPATPSALTASSATETGVSLGWAPASDNLAVAGYRLYRDGTFAGTTVTTSYSFTGLVCGTSYELGVEAYDAADNRSAPATLAAATSACPPAPPPPPPPPPPSAASVFLAPTGSDANACTQTAPCRTMNRGYAVAQPGQTVEMAGGTYPAQRISFQSSKGAAGSYVAFKPGAGATVTVAGDLENRAAWVKVVGIHATGAVLPAEGGPNAHNVVYDQVSAPAFRIGPGHDVTLSNSNIGPQPDCTDENKIGPDGIIPNAVPYNISLLGNYIHDQNGDNPVSGCHFGGLFVIAGHDMTFARNTFARNVVYDIQVQNFTGAYGGAPSNVTIENNWFVGPVEWLPQDTIFDNQPNVQLDCRPGACSYTNWLIRFNSFYAGVALAFDGATTLNSVRVVGNIGRSSYGCRAGATFAYNAWQTNACGSDRLVGSLPYVSGSIANPDFHLTGGVAVDLVPGTNADQQIADDHDGLARPLGSARDAGADELR
jgi:chitodextrinase